MNKHSEKIDKLRKDRGWSVYKFAQESGIYAETVHKWFNGKTSPSVDMIAQSCEAFGITMAEFFAEHELVEMSPRMKQLYDGWCALNADEQASVEMIVKSYLGKKKA